MGARERVFVEVHAERSDPARDREELRRLLTERPRSIPSRYFYDEAGSRLFDEITRLPEYYLTRTEASILEPRAPLIVASSSAEELVELGSGTSTKTRILLDAMSAAGTLRRYIPFDVSEAVVRRAASELAADYPELSVHGIVGEFDRHLDRIPVGQRRLVVFLGSTIGNFELEEAEAFLRAVARPMRAGDFFLLGADLVKDVKVIEAAYNDSRGVTALFNLNILEVVNRTFGGDFRPKLFRHRAFFNREREWIEMRLVARSDHRVRLEELDLTIELSEGEEILTEISSKYRRETIERLLAAGGFELREWLSDDDGYFALALAQWTGP